MKSTSIKNINALIEKGYADRESENAAACCRAFLTAWKELQEAAPVTYTDFSELVADYNQDGTSYDWLGWIWDVCDAIDPTNSDQNDCLLDRLQFINEFKKRFPDTTDIDLLEFLQRALIKTNFLLGKEEEGQEAVEDFYQLFPNSVWGYIEWGDALLKKETPTDATKELALTIYKKALVLKDDPDYMDVLKRRIQRTR